MTSPDPEASAGPAVGGVILDVGALRQMASATSLYARVLLSTATDRGYTLVLPAAVVAAARARADASEAARLHVFRDLGNVLPAALIASDAEDVGALLATTDDLDQTAPADLAAGHAVLLGLRRHQRVVTDRPALLRRIAPDVEIDELP